LFEHIICIPKTHKEEVGITRPSIRDDYDDIFPSCIGYLKKKRRKGEQIIKENNNNDITTICSNKTVDGWRLLRFYKRVGCGKSCYRRVQEAVFNWDFTSHVGKKSKGIISAATECKRSINKTRKNLLATFTEIYIPRPLKSVFVVNPVHVVYDVKNHQKSTTKGRCISSCSAYATLSGHLLSGEERVSVVVWNRGKDEVYVEILSFSRASPSTVGRLIWPLIGGMQKNFFLEELDHLDKVANEI